MHRDLLYTMSFRVWGLEFGVRGIGLRVLGVGLGFRFGVQGSSLYTSKILTPISLEPEASQSLSPG